MKFNPFNLILATDSYKMSQWPQYPPGTISVFSYGESRGGLWDELVALGLQAICNDALSLRITRADIEEAAEFAALHGEPFYRAGWEHILNEHDGYLPLVIRSVPEGTVMKGKNIMYSVENTDPHSFWLTSYVEPLILAPIWHMTSIATLAYHIRQDILAGLELTGTPEDLDFKLHDFGYRGATCHEAAGRGGAAHLMVGWQGSDNIAGIRYANNIYGFSDDYEGPQMAGFSIPATEHSTITSWGRPNEKPAYQNMIEIQEQGATFACVSDSYNMMKALEMWKELEPLILKQGGTLVIRPDSGDPVKTPVAVLERCMELFGYTTNAKGFKVLPDHIRVLQGDGINQDSIKAIIDLCISKHISIDNIAFGMGGALQQGCNRDTLKFAMKCSAILKVKGGVWEDVYKDPITDPGKTSKKGRMSLFVDTQGEFHTMNINNNGEPIGWTDYPIREFMETIYVNGDLIKAYTVDEVRANVARPVSELY